jgi:multidrug resistance protein
MTSPDTVPPLMAASLNTPVDATSSQPTPSPSIFTSRTNALKLRFLLSAAVVSFMVPLTDTIILPTLVQIAHDLPGGTDDGAAALVSVYMAAVGLFTLVWGPLSDTYGRRSSLLLSLVLYLGATAGCVFSPDMTTLIVLRAVQGSVTGSCIAITQGMVADVFAPSERGQALGLYFVPLLLGPIISPVIGGVLADKVSWRGVFVLLAGLSVPMLLLVFLTPETQHWAEVVAGRQRGVFYEEGFAEERGLGGREKADELVDSAEGGGHQKGQGARVLLSSPPPYVLPWRPLAYIIDPLLTPYILHASVLFGVLFSSLSSFPALLVARWAYSPAVVGALYLPIGVAMMVASVTGGKWSDAAGARDPSHPTARLLPSLAGSSSVLAGALVFGWGFHFSSLPVVIVGHCLVGVGHASFGPGFFAYLSSMKQKETAGASAAALAASFVAAGITISAGVPAIDALGVGGWFTLLTGVSVASGAWASWDYRTRSSLAA